MAQLQAASEQRRSWSGRRLPFVRVMPPADLRHRHEAAVTQRRDPAGDGRVLVQRWVRAGMFVVHATNAHDGSVSSTEQPQRSMQNDKAGMRYPIVRSIRESTGGVGDQVLDDEARYGEL